MDARAEIEEQEERLRRAMLAGDVAALDHLLGDGAVYTDHAGVRMGKADDLAAHRSGLLDVTRLDPREPALVTLLGDAAVVSVRVDLAGSHAGQAFAGAFAYTRLWHRADGAWRVEAAHSSAIAEERERP